MSIEHLDPNIGMSSWVSVPRLFYIRLGVKRGIGRTVMLLARHRESLHLMPVRTLDGRILYLDLREPMCMPYLLAGEIWMEDGPTQFVRSVVQPGEVVIDIGANVGWYSTLLSEQVGASGRVYGFEPNLAAYRLLTESAKQYPQLEIIPAAVTDYEGEAELNVSLYGEQSSIGDIPTAVAKQKCSVTTLDTFLQSRGEAFVHFVKCDAEGAELSILRGATRLLESARPPIWLMEFNMTAARSFGYHLDDLLSFFEAVPHAGYQVYKISALSGDLERLHAPINLVRDDAVIVPRWQYHRLVAYLSQNGRHLVGQD